MNNTMRKISEKVLFTGCLVALLTPIFIFKDLLFPYVTSKAYFFRIVIELLLPFYIYLLVTNKQYRPNLKNFIHLSILGFLAVNFVSAIFGVNVIKSFFGNFERMGGVYYLAHLSAFYFYIVLLAELHSEYVRKFLLALAGSGILLAIYGILVWLKIVNFLPDPSYPRISATLGNPIFFGSFLILPMTLTAFFAFSEESRAKKYMYWFFFLLQTVGVFLSATRGAVVGLLVGVGISTLVFLFLSSSKKIKIYVGGILVSGLVVTVLLFSFPQILPTGSLLQRTFNLRGTNSSARIIQWQTALIGFKQRPILGTGPENYYVISNEHYNPEIYNYDKSWFDKPHNYLLEILVTSGIFGFIFYMGILIFGIFGLYKAYKATFLSLIEFSVLLCGFIAYAVQNLFVFDTISASVVFFGFVGFLGFLWKKGIVSEAAEIKDKKHTFNALPKTFGIILFGVTAIVMLYVIYASNFASMSVSKSVNYGFAYSSVDPVKAYEYFEEARQLPFNFDYLEVGGKYVDFAVQIMQNHSGLDPVVVSGIIQHGFEAGETAVRKIPNDPVMLQRLGNAYIAKSIVNKTALDPRAEQYIAEAVSLAPLRPEPQLAFVRLKLQQNNVAGAENILKEMISNFPKNPEVKMQLALVYLFSDRKEKALVLGEEALANNFLLTQAREVMWMGEYYISKNKFSDAVRIYELAAKAEPNNIDVFWQLAQVYSKVGKKEQAIQIAQAIEKAQPERLKEMEEFIKSMK